MTLAHSYLDHGSVFETLREAALMFEQAGASDAANSPKALQSFIKRIMVSGLLLWMAYSTIRHSPSWLKPLCDNIVAA